MQKHLMGGIAAAAAMALSASSAVASLNFLGQIAPADNAVVLNPVSESNAFAETGGYWNPLGSSSPGPWLNIVNGGSATFDARGNFEFVWGSPNPGNIVTTNDGQTYTISDLSSYGVLNNPLGYLVDITGTFTTITLTMSGGDGGNFEVAGTPVPEASTWAMMGLGFAGLAFAGYRSSRRRLEILA